MPSSNIKRKKKPGPTNSPTPNGGSGNYTETAMDEFLARLNLYRKPIAKDGSCLFRAVSEQVYNCQAKHLQVRKDCIDFMRRNREKFEAFLEGPFDHHLFRLQNPKEWAGQVEISALSLMYKKDFVVYQDINAEPTKVTDNNFKDKILLCYSNGNHYDAVYDTKFQKMAAMCQSLVYELLYQNVFGELDRKCGSRQNSPGDVNNMGTANFYQNGLGDEDSFKEDGEDNTGWTEVVRGKSKAKSARQNRGYDQEEVREELAKPNLNQKHGWQAKRSLDNELYRNVELEVWEDLKNVQEQQDQYLAASIQYQPGDKCFAWLGQPEDSNRVYEAIVIYYLPIQGRIEVKIPELQNKRFVILLENLKPSENQHGLRDDGKRGRRRNMQGRPQRGYKGDEHGEDAAGRKGFQDDAFARPRGGSGPREKFGRARGRGRFQRGRDEKQVQKEDEEAKQIAEQAKLAELQGKDPAAFPALPTQQAEERTPSSEAAPDQSPAEFWSRLNNSQLKPTGPPKENHVSTENKPLSVSTANHQQPHGEKELELEKERLLVREVKVPGALNSENVTKTESWSLETSSSPSPLENAKKEQSETQKQPLPVEKELLKGKVDLPKGRPLNDFKQPTTASSSDVESVPLKSNMEESNLIDSAEIRSTWIKDPNEKKDVKTQDKAPDSSAKLSEQEAKKTEELAVKPQGTRGVIRVSNVNNKSQQVMDAEDQEEALKGDSKLFRKEDSIPKDAPNLKSALAGEGPASTSPEKKTVTFAEPLNGGGEFKVLHLAGRDGKRDVHVPSSLVSVVMKPAPSSDTAENLPVSHVPANKADNNTSEDEASNAQAAIPTPDSNTQQPPPSPASEDTNQSNEGADPAPSSSPSVTHQHQSYFQLPFLPVMYVHLPNMTSMPRMPQGISTESDASDLPDDPNTLRYFFNLGFQYHVQLYNQQWANQHMMYYPPSVYQMPSQDHLGPHPAVSVAQPGNPGAPQVIYQHQQMQGYHSPQIQPVMQEGTSFSDRNSLDRSSPGQSQQQQTQQQQQQPQQQQALHQGPFIPAQHHHSTWRAAQTMTRYGQTKHMHMGGYNSPLQNQQNPRGPMQQGAGNNKYYKTKKHQKHRNDQYTHSGAQSQHVQNQGQPMHGAHAYQAAAQPAGSSSNTFFMPSNDHAVGKGSGDYFHGSQQFGNYHGNVSSSMTQAPHSASNTRAQQYS